MADRRLAKAERFGKLTSPSSAHQLTEHQQQAVIQGLGLALVRDHEHGVDFREAASPYRRLISNGEAKRWVFLGRRRGSGMATRRRMARSVANRLRASQINWPTSPGPSGSWWRSEPSD